jgi:hypothetical protein
VSRIQPGGAGTTGLHDGFVREPFQPGNGTIFDLKSLLAPK